LTFTNILRKIKYDIDTNTTRIGNIFENRIQFPVEAREKLLRTYVEA